MTSGSSKNLGADTSAKKATHVRGRALQSASLASMLGLAVGAVAWGQPVRHRPPCQPNERFEAPWCYPSPRPHPPSRPSERPASSTSATCPRGMMFIPGGSFLMGSPSGTGETNEDPIHRVQLSSFCMDRTEVTVAAFRLCVSTGACSAPTGMSCNWQTAGREQHPVNCVDWGQAMTYCRTNGARLPTEAEWEYAARGTDGRTYPWGNTAPTTRSLCFGRMHDQGTCEVASFPRDVSPFGVFDMGGNLVEWVSDWYDPYSSNAQIDPTGPATEPTERRGRVTRGGVWGNPNPSRARAARRDWNPQVERNETIGFRCVHNALN